MYAIIMCDFCQWQKACSVVLLAIGKYSQVSLERLILALCLSICLRMECGTQASSRLRSFIVAYISAHVLLMNSKPLSETIPLGVPNLDSIPSKMASARSSASHFLCGRIYYHPGVAVDSHKGRICNVRSRFTRR